LLAVQTVADPRARCSADPADDWAAHCSVVRHCSADLRSQAGCLADCLADRYFVERCFAAAPDDLHFEVARGDCLALAAESSPVAREEPSSPELRPWPVAEVPLCESLTPLAAVRHSGG
jgi:hypothetical protein